ncbi:hypothetical protein [Alkalibacterium sp. MB6]|uniref:hypothetical protein n=1 Tax=Alkalibacterium sp. MB6 TaxID=2081965 RepID=UPI001379E87F|nr:hypothetical protein [Alkalibacterium sp. MB6]
MKHTVKSIVVLAASVVLTGCQTNTNAESEPAGPIEPIDGEPPITKVTGFLGRSHFY